MCRDRGRDIPRACGGRFIGETVRVVPSFGLARLKPVDQATDVSRRLAQIKSQPADQGAFLVRPGQEERPLAVLRQQGSLGTDRAIGQLRVKGKCPARGDRNRGDTIAARAGGGQRVPRHG